MYTFGNGEKQRMIVAGIHGGYEWNTIALADELITYIYENPDIIPSDVKLYILRNLNPDGDARDHGYDGRVNDHGVDLNRNFPTNWAAEWDRDGCWDYGPTTGGTGPGSEPETRTLMGFLQTHKIEALISYHSAALGVFPGGEPWEENSIQFAKDLARCDRLFIPAAGYWMYIYRHTRRLRSGTRRGCRGYGIIDAYKNRFQKESKSIEGAVELGKIIRQ